MDAMRIVMRYFATAQHNGAMIQPYAEVTGLLRRGRPRERCPAFHDWVTGKEGVIHADLVVNATGPWSEQVAAMAG